MIEFMSEEFCEPPREFDGVVQIRLIFTLSYVKHSFMSMEPRGMFDGYGVDKPGSNLDEPGLTGFEQLINFVSSS
jgi:hypothetical protein